MIRKYIRHATEDAARQRIAAIDQAMGYPAPATSRGANCPAHPFGQTLTHSEPVRVSADEWATAEAPAEVVGRVERVEGADVTIDNDGATELPPELVDAPVEKTR